MLRSALGATRTRIGLGVAGFVVLLALVGPFIAPHPPTAFVGGPFQGPSATAWLGTDDLGRDVLSRVLSGGYYLLGMALAAASLGVAAGTMLGVLAAYSRRVIDELVMRSLDVVLSFPQLILVLLFVSVVGTRLWLVALTIAGIYAPPVARVTRAAALQVRGREFVQAAEASGVSRWRIMLTEIVPNISSPILAEFGLRLTYAVGLAAALSFLGFGVQPPTADWGRMTNENRIGLVLQPLSVIAPVTAIALLAVGVNLVTDGFARAAIGIERRDVPG